MYLPNGVTYSPQQEKLIARDARACICIDTRAYPENVAYEKINERTFGSAVQPYLHGDWAECDGFQLQMDPGAIVYSGAEHIGSPKLPNITALRNWLTIDRSGSPSPYLVMASTMGHSHPKDPTGPRIQEVYEFRSPGLMVLDHENGAPEIWVAKDGDKVAVPDGCHMTLYNLGDIHQTLITLPDLTASRRSPRVRIPWPFRTMAMRS